MSIATDISTIPVPEADLIGRFEPGTPDWHAAREGRLGGSEMASILGLSAWESAYSLWHRKAGLIRPVEQTPAMRWGHLLEPVIAAVFQEAHPELLVALAGTYVNRQRPWQLANPDRLAVDRTDSCCGVEIKTARTADGWGERGTDEIPVYYRTQVQHYMDTLGLTEFWVPVLIGGSDYREYRVAYDPQDALLLRQAGDDFMASLAAGTPPPIDESEATYTAVKDVPAAITDEVVEIPPALASRYFAARATYSDAEADKRQACALILAAIGTGRMAVCNDLPVAVRTVHADGTTHSLQPAKGI